MKKTIYVVRRDGERITWSDTPEEAIDAARNLHREWPWCYHEVYRRVPGEMEAGIYQFKPGELCAKNCSQCKGGDKCQAREEVKTT